MGRRDTGVTVTPDRDDARRAGPGQLPRGARIGSRPISDDMGATGSLTVIEWMLPSEGFEGHDHPCSLQDAQGAAATIRSAADWHPAGCAMAVHEASPTSDKGDGA